MIDVVKTALYISLDCPYRLVFGFHTCIDDIDNIPDSVLLRPVRAETIAMRIESRFAYWFQNQSHTFLYNPVQYCGNTQRTLFAVCLFDILPFGWLWFVVGKIILNQLK